MAAPTYSAGLLNVGTMNANGTSAVLEATDVNVTNLTATTVNATNFNNPNLNVTGTSTVQGQQVALAAGGWDNLPTKTLPNTMKIVLQSCENTIGDIISKKMKLVNKSEVFVTSIPGGCEAIALIDQQMHEQMCGYVSSLNPDVFLHTGDSGYSSVIASNGRSNNILDSHSESYGSLPNGIRTLIGYTDISGNAGPLFNAMLEREQDANSEMWLQSPGGQLLRKQVEQKGGFHMIWDDNDAASNNMGSEPSNLAYTSRQFYKNKLNGWGAKTIVDGYDSSGNVLTIESKLDGSNNPRYYYNGTLYNPKTTSVTQPAGQVTTIYRSWDQELDKNDGTDTKFKIRFIVMDDQHFDNSTGSTLQKDVNNPTGWSPIFYPSVSAGGRAAVPYVPSDASGVRLNSFDADLSGFQARFTDSSGVKFEYYADPRYTETRNFFGDKQLNWAKGKILDASSFDLIIIMTGTPLWIENYNQDSLSQYPYERQLFTNFIRQHKVDNLVFTSGDTHFNYVSQKQNVAGYPILDIVSSGVSLGVPLTLQDGPSRDTMWGPSWDQPEYRDPVTNSMWKKAGLIFPYNSRMYQFMTMDIILPGSIDSVTGDKFVDVSGNAISTPTIRLTQHIAPNIGNQTLVGPLNTSTGISSGVCPWRPLPNFYDIQINTLKHSYWVGKNIETHFNKNPVNPWKLNPCNFVKNPSTGDVEDALTDPMVPWNRTNIATQVSSSPIMDISGNYLTDSSGNFLQIPQDFLCEILPAKHDISGNYIDASGLVITAQCYIPQYTDTVNKYNFIVFDSSNSAVAALGADLSGYYFDQVCKYDASYNPYTPSNKTFTGGSGKVYHLAYDGSAGNPSTHIRDSSNWFVYGAASIDYTPTSCGVTAGGSPLPLVAWNNLPENPMCPYVEDCNLGAGLNNALKNIYDVKDLSGNPLVISTATGIISNYYASYIYNVVGVPGTGIPLFTTFNRKYFVTVTRDPSGMNVSTATSKSFQLPLNFRNYNSNAHASIAAAKDFYYFAKASAPFPYAFGFARDQFNTDNDSLTAFGWMTKPTLLTANNGCGDVAFHDGYGMQQCEKTQAAICGAAGYVGESPTFTFYTTDQSGNDIRVLKTIKQKLKFKNNTIFTNIPGNNQFSYACYSSNFVQDMVGFQDMNTPTIFYELGYQWFGNVMKRMCYGTNNLGKNMVTWPGVNVVNSAGVDAVDLSGNYTVLFTDSSNNVDWDIWTTSINTLFSGGNPVDTSGTVIYYPGVPGVPILAGYSGQVPDKSTLAYTGPNYVNMQMDVSGVPITVKVPITALSQFRNVRFKNVGTSVKMTNLWYEYNSLINALFTKDLSGWSVFTDSSGGFTGSVTTMQSIITPFATKGPLLPSSASSDIILPLINNRYSSLSYQWGAVPRTLYDIYRVFNNRYFGYYPATFVDNGGSGRTTKTQFVSSNVKWTTN